MKVCVWFFTLTHGTVFFTLTHMHMHRHRHMCMCMCITRGSLLLKWGTLTPNLLKCPYGQMGTKPAKVGHLAATLLKYVPKKQKQKTVPPGGSNPGRLI